jgi:hypothetical protein
LRKKHSCSSQATNPRIECSFWAHASYSFPKLTDHPHSQGRKMADARGVPRNGGTRERPVRAGREERPGTVRRRSYELARELQSIKIRELRDALVTAGYSHLTAQARALGLSRSTTWSILQANHKGTGISGSVIKRMLDQPGLPSLVRGKIFEYVDEKSAGMYGHKGPRLRRFATALTRELRSKVQSSDVLHSHLRVHGTTTRNKDF